MLYFNRVPSYFIESSSYSRVLSINYLLRYYYYFKIPNHMEFLRTKMTNIYQHSKNMLKYRQKGTEGKRAVEAVLNSSKDNVGLDLLQKLSQLSFNSQEYTELFNFLIVKIAEFSYQEKNIKKTLKVITILSHLLRTGNSNLSKDLANNTDILQKLQKLNSHYFELTHPINTKQLEYKLELIKQRAKFILMLLKDEQLLSKERSSLMITNHRQLSEPIEAETAFELKLHMEKQKPFSSKSSSSQRNEQVSVNYFQNEEVSPKPSNKPFFQNDRL